MFCCLSGLKIQGARNCSLINSLVEVSHCRDFATGLSNYISVHLF